MSTLDPATVTPLDCVLDPSLAPKPVDEQGQPTHTIDVLRGSAPSDPDAYHFSAEEGRQLRRFAEEVCAPHDTYPAQGRDFDRQAAFELAKMIHAKYQANVEILRKNAR